MQQERERGEEDSFVYQSDTGLIDAESDMPSTSGHGTGTEEEAEETILRHSSRGVVISDTVETPV